MLICAKIKCTPNIKRTLKKIIAKHTSIRDVLYMTTTTMNVFMLDVVSFLTAKKHSHICLADSPNVWPWLMQ